MVRTGSSVRFRSGAPLSEIKEKVLSAFQCQKTGNCCRFEGYVYADENEITRMAEFLKLDVKEFMKRFVRKDNGWHLIASPTFRKSCFLNKENGCKIYPVRPEKCKTYPNWPELWETPEAILQELALCKGLKKAFEDTQESPISGNSDSK